MQVLFLSLVPPLPANNGHSMRSWALLRALAAEGAEITLLTFVPPGTECDVPGLRPCCRSVETLPQILVSASGGQDYAGRFASLFSHLPYMIRRFASPDMRSRVAAQLQTRSFDAIVGETIFSLLNVPATDVPIILDQHNIEHLIVSRYARLQRNPLKWWYAAAEADKLRRSEVAGCRRAAVVLCCSEHDRGELRRLCPEARYSVAPNVIDTGYDRPAVAVEERSSFAEGTTARAAQPPIILYQGGMDWLPNRDAVEFFVASVLPLVQKEVPQVQFVAAGRNPPPAFLSRFAGLPAVKFTGTVPDMRAIIAQAAVCVVPLRIGSGTRLKILEAAALAKPIVSTTLGAEGLELRAGKELLLADQAGPFAQAVVELLRDRTRAEAMGRAARALTEREYSFAVLRTCCRQVLELVAGAQAVGQRESQKVR
jgi:glycosyltransferase involved in cell wall biosynthesis